MAVVERVSHDVGVMYLGRLVEIGPRQSVFENPSHPYTQALLKAVPIADPKQRKTGELQHKPISSPVRPLGHEPEPSVYREISPGHFVLETDCGY
jgi:peptide/nickel transport system ATP-binding protein/glutathione transport system ATP-binding protein